MNRQHIKADSVDATVITTKRIDLEGVSLNGYTVQKIFHDVKVSSNASIAESLDEIRRDIQEIKVQIASLQTLLQLPNGQNGEQIINQVFTDAIIIPPKETS